MKRSARRCAGDVDVVLRRAIVLIGGRRLALGTLCHGRRAFQVPLSLQIFKKLDRVAKGSIGTEGVKQSRVSGGIGEGRPIAAPGYVPSPSRGALDNYANGQFDRCINGVAVLIEDSTPHITYRVPVLQLTVVLNSIVV